MKCLEVEAGRVDQVDLELLFYIRADRDEPFCQIYFEGNEGPKHVTLTPESSFWKQEFYDKEAYTESEIYDNK